VRALTTRAGRILSPPARKGKFSVCNRMGTAETTEGTEQPGRGKRRTADGAGFIISGSLATVARVTRLQPVRLRGGSHLRPSRIAPACACVAACQRTIHMAGPFQPTSPARLALAHRRALKRIREGRTSVRSSVEVIRGGAGGSPLGYLCAVSAGSAVQDSPTRSLTPRWRAVIILTPAPSPAGLQTETNLDPSRALRAHHALPAG